MPDTKEKTELSVDDLKFKYRLPPKLAELFLQLLSNEHVSAGSFVCGANTASAARVTVWRLRNKLKPYGIEIHNTVGTVYWVDEETRSRIIEKS